jgi:hypothetical protein
VLILASKKVQVLNMLANPHLPRNCDMRSTYIVLNGGKQRSDEVEGNAVADWSAAFVRIVGNPEVSPSLPGGQSFGRKQCSPPEKRFSTLPGISRAKSNRDPTILEAKPKRNENRTIIRLLCSWLLERGLGPMRSLHR